MKAYVQGIWINKNKEIFVNLQLIDEVNKLEDFVQRKITKNQLINNYDLIGTEIEME